MSSRKFKSKNLVLSADGPLTFGEITEDGSTVTADVSLVARTNTPVNTWMGQFIHDLKGMFHKDKVNLDWRHDSDESIGYLDRFEVTDKQITCFGKVVSVDPSDKAFQIMKKAQAGVPFESSIYFGGQGIEIEEIPVNKTAEVNGASFDGPGVIFRKWPMRGVALCPYGADNSTSSQFNFEDGEVEYTATILEKEKEIDMADEITKEALNAEASKKKEDARLEAQKLEEASKKKEITGAPVSPDGLSGADFISAFGENGAVWFAEGKTFSEAMVCHYQKLEATVRELTERIDALKKDAGSSIPVDFDDDDDDAAGKRKKNVAKKTKELENKIGPNLAAFAANLIIRR